MIAIKIAAFAAVLLASFCNAIHLVKRTDPPAVVGLPIEKDHVPSNDIKQRAAWKPLSQTLENNVRHADSPFEQKTN